VSDRETLIYHGKIVYLVVERVTLPNGAIADLEIVRHPGGAAVVALDSEQQVCLLHQYRHAAGGWVWELPAGKLEPNETPLATAQRELQEETGVQAGHWEPLGDIISSPGVFTETVHLFLARDLSEVPNQVEPHEVFEVHWLPLPQAIAWAREGEIRDAKTLAGLFRASMQE